MEALNASQTLVVIILTAAILSTAWRVIVVILPTMVAIVMEMEELMEALNASQTLVLAIPTAVILSTASQENVLVIIFEAVCVYITHVMCCLIVVFILWNVMVRYKSTFHWRRPW
jgi:hypothetical protein